MPIISMNYFSSLKFACAAFLFLLLSTTACVTKKKYDDLTYLKVQSDTEAAANERAVATARVRQQKLEEELEQLLKANQKLISDSTTTGLMLRKTQRLNADLTATYDKLLKNQEQLMSNSATESSRLAANLTQREAELKAIDANLQASKSQVDKLSGDLRSREERLNELERVLAEKDQAVNALRTQVSNALLGFKAKDLTVNMKNGKVYVSLAEQLLFKSGSTKVDPKGQEALQQLAKALKEQREVNVLVEGHTDDVPVAKLTGIQDNWDLSVLRATEITRILTKSGLAAAQVTPSGRAETTPLETGKTPEIRQKNRRTEIILTPKLDELFQILEKN